MEHIKKLINKITGDTKMRKDQLLIMVLCGILLCIVAIPTGEKNKNSGFFKKESQKQDSDYGIVDNNLTAQGSTEAPASDYDLSYISYWEGKLEQSLSRIDGVGEVKVLITLKESEERVTQKDMDEEIKETAETDAEGGSRRITEKRLKESTIYTVNDDGQDVPYISKVMQPVVEGVVVIAQGGGSDTVKLNIIETIKVLFAIDVNKIRVVKMKTNTK